jgi:hypothetical protein
MSLGLIVVLGCPLRTCIANREGRYCLVLAFPTEMCVIHIMTLL